MDLYIAIVATGVEVHVASGLEDDACAAGISDGDGATGDIDEDRIAVGAADLEVAVHSELAIDLGFACIGGVQVDAAGVAGVVALEEAQVVVVVRLQSDARRLAQGYHCVA